ncbi:ATP-binding protein [Neobacillus sp. PS3-34]|uniref:two-component system histidine kinase PnpS n=1 Tax=Neobacillus sp. PS3-34 TaxID=3070678 RepID=UPI0027DFB644|nr:ATP-binding protein [Neobacillus sp. PS3-34]WML47317.1 ATP-binding protein [Neobacillus sp. PS3-34]
MTKFRTRLLFALITLIISVLLGLGLLLGQLFKNYYLHSFDDRLKKESNLLSMHIVNNGGIALLDKQELIKTSRILETRITLSDNQGRILFDSGKTTGKNKSRHEQIIKKAVTKKSNKQSKLETSSGNELHYYGKPILLNNKITGYVFLSAEADELKKAYRQIWWLLSISLGLALIVIILLGFRITTRYTKPIESATHVAIELAKGNYRARTYEDRLDETGMLSASINVLARNLQEMVKAQEMQQDRLGALIENMGSGLILIDSRGYINLINRGYKEIFKANPADYLYQLYYEVVEHKEVCQLIEEVFMTEQKVSRQMHLPLAIERRYFDVYGVPIIGSDNVWKGVLLVFHDITELKNLEQMRKDFVANVSHELKTPVTSIKGFSETLLEGAMDDRSTLEAFLSIILKESDRLQSLIQDLLELSKIEQNGFILSVQEFDLLSTIEEVLTMLRGKAEAKSIHLDFECSKDSILIEGDAYRLKQVLINLITNAISYTPANGTVKITVQKKGDKIRIQVKDTGIGIEKKEIPRIFERFYRVDRARSRNSGGTGLGLAIVKHLVEAHHGKISVKSEVGSGSEFIIELYQAFPKEK